jgi:arylformamidase
MKKILDITFPLSANLTVWPNDPPVRMEAIREAGKGARSTISRLEMGSHSGTHLDAPSHFIEGGGTVDALDLDILIGECLAAEVEADAITAEVIDSLNIPDDVQRVIFKTRNSQRFTETGDFFRDYVGVTTSGARRLLEMGIKLVGTDYLSAAAYSDITQVHCALLDGGVVLLEMLNLKDIRPGRYELVCLPLKLAGADGSPCRAVLIEDAKKG